jgi:radical SAM superfamily enzyme YgiQ (UPF0313 family)
MKIALAFPPFYLEPMYNLPPLGLANLATALKGSTHSTVLLDFPLFIRQGAVKMGRQLYDECARRIMDEQPDLVGFSVQCTTYPPSIQIARKLKSLKPSLKVVFGGHGATSMDENLISSYPWIDAVVRGEGERSFPELVDSYEHGLEGAEVAGVTCRMGGTAVRNPDRDLINDLDELPLTDYGFLPPFARYRDACHIRRSIAILEVGRGCPHRCIYCSQSVMWKRRTRTFSVERLVNEMHHLRQQFQAECFLLAYDQFTSRRTFVEEFCRRVIQEELNDVPWYCISRLDSVDPALLALMREAGCESMCYGIDSGSKRTLAFIRKQIDHDILYQRVKETTEQGIVPTLSFVIGFPEEEKEDIDATLDLALRTGVLGNVNPLIQLATILPGTDLHLKYAHQLVREVDTYFSLGIEFDDGRRLPSDESMINSNPDVFSSFYNLPCPGRSLEELNSIAGSFHLIASLYPRSFLLLGMESGASASDLYFRWLKWLNERRKKIGTTFSPQELYQYFSPFADELLVGKGTVQNPHIPEVIKYETLAIEAGRHDASLSHFHLDLGNIAEIKPIRNEKIVRGEFTFNMTEIIFDLKNGFFRESYPHERSLIIFLQEGDRLQVSEINEFGMDLLGLCNGKNTVRNISDQLASQYGKNMPDAEFFGFCVEAVETLGHLKMLQVGQPDYDREGR